MTKPDPALIRAHEDRDMFQEAVSFTAAETGFAARLVEKDYFCTVLLQELAAAGALVFKGGTCLAKVHAEFYRLSEDLDFVIPTLCDAPRAARSKQAAGLKRAVAELAKGLNVFRVIEPLAGAKDKAEMSSAVVVLLLCPQPQAACSHGYAGHRLSIPIHRTFARSAAIPLVGLLA